MRIPWSSTGSLTTTILTDRQRSRGAARRSCLTPGRASRLEGGRPRNGGLGRVWVVVALCAGFSRPAVAQPRTFVVDAKASQVRVALGRSGLFGFLGHGHTIAAPVADGRIEADPADLARSRVELRWEAARLSVVPGTEPAGDIPEVEGRMRGADVLDTARYGEISFVSRAVGGRVTGPGDYRLDVRGTLVLKGRPHEIEVPLDVHADADALVAHGSVPLRLRDLGVAPPSVAGVVKVSNEFTLTFEIHARRDAAAP
jgi:polyisoprenoid-binding protein YceI